MSPFWGGIIIGCFIGLTMGVILAGLLAGAKCGECGGHIERWIADRTE